jgi:hypothetical protein
MRYRRCESEILSALAAVRMGDSIVSRWRIEEEIRSHPDRYPGLAALSVISLRRGIFQVLSRQDDIRVLSKDQRAFAVIR